jgi:hypothetical protein
MSKSIKLTATKPAARKSATVELQKLAPAPIIDVKAKMAKATAKPEVFVDQGVVDSFLAAEQGAGDAAIALFIACTLHRVSPAQFGTRPDAKVRASEFNSATAVADMLKSAAAARAIIDKASKAPGNRRSNVLAALRSARVTGKALSSSALKGNALAKEITKRAETATAANVAQLTAKKAAARKARAPSAPKPDTLAGYMPIALAALIDMQKQLGKLSVPARMLRKVEDLSSALVEAIDAATACNEG